MRRTVLLAVVALLFVTATAQAAPIGVGVGAFGGLSWPILQDDVGSGSVFGVRVPVKALSMLTFEGYYMKSSLGEGEEEIGGVTYTREGFDHTGLGVNLVFGSGGMGTGFYPYVGIGSHEMERTGTEIDETAWNFGLGYGISAGAKLSVQIRGELNMIVTGDTSRKFGNATAGLTYSLMP